jgi:hypothetical protein
VSCLSHPSLFDFKEPKKRYLFDLPCDLSSVQHAWEFPRPKSSRTIIEIASAFTTSPRERNNSDDNEMAAPRATQFVALRNLARHGSHHQQVRSLHMTGPATYASPVLTQERSILNIPRDIAGLRAECKRRRIDASGDKQDVSLSSSPSCFLIGPLVDHASR